MSRIEREFQIFAKSVGSFVKEKKDRSTPVLFTN
jgi:hypothetical protein